MNDYADISKILADVREGLVVHPGDHLILSFPADRSPKDLQEIRDRLWERFKGAGIEVTLVTAVTQIAVIRQDDLIRRGEDFDREVIAAIRRQNRLGIHP